MRYFKFSIFITVLGLVAAFFWGGLSALFLVAVLSILEISLSFDNAVVNASILQKMTPRWQQRFLFWGILIAVFVVRFLLPVVIVSLVTKLHVSDILSLILNNPKEYAAHLHQTKSAISAFGGMFLLLVFLSFIFQEGKEVHWLGVFEKKLNAIGKLDSIEIIIALTGLIILQHFVPSTEKLSVLMAGSIGIVLFVLLNSISQLLASNKRLLKKNGVVQFIYLEILDASFSLDAVIGAFAITKDIILILLGLTIGAVFVRSTTLFLVRKGTLKHYRFLEHGAHYAIGALAVIMLLSIKITIPELIIAFIGIVFIGLSLLSSIKHQKNRG